MVLFFVGILEMIIVTTWTKVVTKTKVLASGLVTVINILIWYYVLETIVNDINNWSLVILYAFGCAFGTMLTTFYYSKREEKQKKDAADQKN
jgi:purine-cytosine permease-like protein